VSTDAATYTPGDQIQVTILNSGPDRILRAGEMQTMTISPTLDPGAYHLVYAFDDLDNGTPGDGPSLMRSTSHLDR
jgi:hypothetical protein